MQKHHHLLYRAFGTYRSSPCTLSHHRYWHPVFRPIGKHKNTFIYSITPPEHRIYHLPIYRAIGTLNTSPTCSLSHHHNTHIYTQNNIFNYPPAPSEYPQKLTSTLSRYTYIINPSEHTEKQHFHSLSLAVGSTWKHRHLFNRAIGIPNTSSIPHYHAIETPETLASTL